jgi:hypothetical protein
MPTRGRGGGIGGGGFDKSTTTFVAPVTNNTRRHSSNYHYDSLIKINLPRVVTRGSMATLTLARMRCLSPSKKWSAVRTLS